MTELKRGKQVVYVPTIAGGDLDHSACEDGFITSTSRHHTDAVFCRYWSKYDEGELRTRAGSELTPTELLKTIDTVPQEQVDAMLERIDADDL